MAGKSRHNHAIWDQLGLLHWLRHNVASFNGAPSSVTLVAADNRASRQLQLLALSPLSKGKLCVASPCRCARLDAPQETDPPTCTRIDEKVSLKDLF